MDAKELALILKKGEDYKTEFKESVHGIDAEMVAFANAEGGKIFLGVDDKGNAKGLDVTNKLKSQIQDTANNCDPSIEIGLLEYANILVVEVKEGKDKPYKCKEGFFMRIGPNSQKMGRDQILSLAAIEGKIRFDEKANEDFDVGKDLNREAYKTFVRLSKITESIYRKDLFENLSLTRNQKLKNAGVLLFCNDVTRFFTYATVTCVTFQGKERVKILDRKEYASDLYSNFQDASNYLKEKLNTEYT